MDEMQAELLRRLAKTDAAYQRNSQYAVPPGDTNYTTKLEPEQEAAFQSWVANNKVPYEDSPTADYDMRGYFQALQNGDPETVQSLNPNDGQMHFTDKFKTPYHQSFSAESIYATPDAPTWNDKDQLVDKQGRVIFDERAPH